MNQKPIEKGCFRPLVVCVAVLVLSQAAAAAQQPPSGSAPAHPVLPIGLVTEVQPNGFVLRTDAGPSLQVKLSEEVTVLRVPPGAKNLSSAARILASDIHTGDRVLVRGKMSDDHQSILAASVIVMTQTDLAKAREAERLEWQHHGIGGIVKAVDAATKQLTISVPNTPPTPQNPTHPVIISLAANAMLLRYAPDSVKFSDAKPAGFEEIRVGDQVRALGTRSEDGSHFTAGKLVSGTFRTISATVISVDAAAGTVTVKDLASGQPVLVRTNADTGFHRLPPFLAEMIAAFNSPGEPTAHATPVSHVEGATPPNHAEGPPERAPGRGPGGGPGNIQQMLEHSPSFKLGELKPGEPLVVVSTEGAKPSEVTAVTVLSGVEPILAARPKGSGNDVLGPWNMSMGQGGEGAP